MRNMKLDEFDLVEPPNIRDGFYGGRCEPVKLIYDFDDEKRRGKYIDVVSLYPTVMYYDRYPTGHPAKICKPEQYDYNWFGFIHCKVLPPGTLPPAVSPKALSLVHYSSSCTPLLSVPSFPLVP